MTAKNTEIATERGVLFRDANPEYTEPIASIGYGKWNPNTFPYTALAPPV